MRERICAGFIFFIKLFFRHPEIIELHQNYAMEEEKKIATLLHFFAGLQSFVIKKLRFEIGN